MKKEQLWKGRIVKVIDHREMWWNSDGEMDHWMGQVVCIKEFLGKWVHIEDDQNERSSGWAWQPEDFVQPTNKEIADYKRRRKEVS